MSFLRQRKGLSLILAGYLLASILYATLIPEGGNPDEAAHKIYVRELAQDWELPVFESGSGNY